MNFEEAKYRDEEACESDSEHEVGQVEPSALLVEHAVVFLKGVCYHFHLESVLDILGSGGDIIVIIDDETGDEDEEEGRDADHETDEHVEVAEVTHDEV